MAKVMVSIPDDLLLRLDREAQHRGETRSGLLRMLVEREIGVRSPERQAEIEALLALAGPEGGDNAAKVRADRDSGHRRQRVAGRV